MIAEIERAAPGDIELGYRILAGKFHPDLGGNHDQMVALNLAMEELREWV
jgi:curved DNA-binding protein CbpA